MEELRTEEEQIAALKKWWKENGTSLVIGVVVALGAVFAWNGYESSVKQEKTEASLMFQQLIEVATQNNIVEADDANTVSYLAQEIKTKFDTSEYAIYAAMFIAKESVKEGNLEAAKTELNWILSHSEDSRIKHIATARLARILASEDKTDEALALLNATDSEFEAAYLEIVGDINQRTGDKEQALVSYKKAYSLVKDKAQVQPLLAVKLADLGVDPETL